jgi:hypothetical protein
LAHEGELVDSEEEEAEGDEEEELQQRLGGLDVGVRELARLEKQFREVVHGHNMAKLVFKSKWVKTEMELTQEHLRCMQLGVWLNDEVINFYIGLLQVG